MSRHGPPGKRRGPVTQPAPSRIEVATTDTAAVMVDDGSGRDARPRCNVVGVYCESLGWLRREPACSASVCSRHFWRDVEAVAP